MTKRMSQASLPGLIQACQDMDCRVHRHIVEGCDVINSLAHILNEHRSSRLKDSPLGINAFTLVSDSYYYENYHSDVIREFLDPAGSHGEGTKFINHFLCMINQELGHKDGCRPLEWEQFANAEVLREHGRMDIGIFTQDHSKLAIIIENKMNHAGDMPQQIPRYVALAHARGYEVAAVIYLPLDTKKQPDQSGWADYLSDPAIKDVIDHRMIVIPGIHACHHDLLHQWLIPCELSSSNNDATAILRQYRQLLTHLARKGSAMSILEQFYKTALHDDAKLYRQAQDLVQLLKELPEYRRELLRRHFEHQREPFSELHWHYTNKSGRYVVFQGPDDNVFKIDIIIQEERYLVQFFAITGDVEMARECLRLIGLDDKFHIVNNSRMERIYRFPEDENALYQDTTALLKGLKQSLPTLPKLRTNENS